MRSVAIGLTAAALAVTLFLFVGRQVPMCGCPVAAGARVARPTPGTGEGNRSSSGIELVAR
jgi:hypothetical protein